MSKWISVKERLPKEKWEQYLVVCKTKGGYDGSFVSIEMAEFYPDQEPNKDWGMEKATTHYWTIIGDMNIPFDVTHWMPLPKLPKEK